MKREAQTFSLLDLAGAKVLAYVKWDLPDTQKGQTQNQVSWLFCKQRVLVQLYIVEYDGWTMSQPGTLEELGIVLNFWPKEIDIDEIILPMRDIIELSARAKIEKAWMANNSVMIHEPKSTLKTTEWVVKILDVKYISMQ